MSARHARSVRTRRRVVAGAAALTTALLAVPASSMADQISLDGDGVGTSNSKNTQLELCPGVGSSVDVFATVSYGGSRHFANNGTVTITASVPTEAAGFITAAGASVSTSSWNDNKDSVRSAAMPLVVGSGWVPGQYKIDYTFAGRDQDGQAYTDTATNNVQISARSTGCGGDTGGGGSTPPPNTAPTVDVLGVDEPSYEIGSVATPTCFVDDAEDVGESAVPQVTGPEGPLAAYGLGTVTVTCSYEDAGGLTGSDVATYEVVDTGAPVISDLGPSTDPNGRNGWYISPVTNGFRATDAGAGFPTANPPLLTKEWTGGTGAAEGPAVTVGSGTVADVAGNEATAIESKPFAVDLGDPELNVNGAPSGTYDLCSGALPTRPTFRPYDAVSGLDGTEGDTWSTPATATGVGSYSWTATATDVAGRTSTETRTYRSVYGGAFTGVTQPINGGSTATFDDDTSRFKLGSTVPVKFALTCSGSPVAGAVARLNVKKYDSTPDAGTDEAVSTAASTTGNLFRYDATAGQYVFNLSTKGGYTDPATGTTTSFAPGTYTLSVLLDDGSSHSVKINLVK